MSNMDTLFAKFFVQALAQAPQAKLVGAEQAGGHVSSPARGGSCDNESPLLACTLPDAVFHRQFVFLELEDRGFRECKGSNNVRLRRLGYLFIANLEERLPGSIACIPQGSPDLAVEMRFDVGEGGVDICGFVCGNWERSRFTAGCIDLFSEFVEVVWVPCDEGYSISAFREETTVKG